MVPGSSDMRRVLIGCGRQALVRAVAQTDRSAGLAAAKARTVRARCALTWCPAGSKRSYRMEVAQRAALTVACVAARSRAGVVGGEWTNTWELCT